MTLSPAVTPIFDQMNRDWIETHGQSLLGLHLVEDINPEADQAILDEKVGTLPMFDSFESSFTGEYIDFSSDHSRAVLTEPDMTAPDGQTGADDGRFRDFDRMPPAEVKALPADALTSEEIAWVLLNWADLLGDKSVEQWFEASSWQEMEDVWDDACVNLRDVMPDVLRPITVGMCLYRLRSEREVAIMNHPARHAHPIVEDEQPKDDRPVVQPISLLDRANRKKKK